MLQTHQLQHGLLSQIIWFDHFVSFPLPTIRAFPHLQKPTKLPKPWTFLDIFGFFASWFLRSGFIPRKWSNMVEWPPYAAINLGCPSLVVPYVYTHVYTTHVQENSFHIWWCTIIDIHAFIIDDVPNVFGSAPRLVAYRKSESMSAGSAHLNDQPANPSWLMEVNFFIVPVNIP